MLGEILKNAASASIIGCMALALLRKGAQKEILRIAVGILLILAVIQPISQNGFFAKAVPVFGDVSSVELRKKQDAIYRDALEETTETMIEDYFHQKEMSVDAAVSIDQHNDVKHLILYPQQAYEWTQEDAKEFDRWSGIGREKQEWIWN